MNLAERVIAGAGAALGVEPLSQGAHALGGEFGQYTQWGFAGGTVASGSGSQLSMFKEVPRAATWRQGAAQWGMPAANIGFTVANVYTGYRAGGLGGAWDAMTWEVGMQAGVLAARGVGGTGPLKKLRFGGVPRYIGAAVGASIGQSVGQSLGIPFTTTAFTLAGGTAGAMPLRTIARHPLLAAGAVAGGMAAGAVYGGAHLLKMGRRHAAQKRSIHTSGSMAAFHTRGAYTMRQRAVQAMSKSHLNARSALGSEASLMARPMVNYHSRYR